MAALLLLLEVEVGILLGPQMVKINAFMILYNVHWKEQTLIMFAEHCKAPFSLAVKGKKTHKCCNIVCGILFLTEGSGQPQLSRVFQDAPKRRTLSDTASHTGLSPSHTEIRARSVCVACLCWDVSVSCVPTSPYINCGQASRYKCALKVTAQFQ